MLARVTPRLLRSSLRPSPVRALAAAVGPVRSLQMGRSGNGYKITEEHRFQFEEKGYITLFDFLTEEELRPIEAIYNRFMTGEIPVPGKDFCDMSGDFSRKPSEFEIINAMLPRKYYPALANNIYEQRAADVVRQLFPGTPMALDYDQLLCKRPQKKNAVFAWHQDMAYWPPASVTPDTRTATFSLAVDPTNVANGCIKFIAGSHKAKTVREHKPIGSTREEAHAIAIDVKERSFTNPTGEFVEYAEVPRGSVTIHNEYVVHGSGGNLTDGTRRTYVVAFRTKATVDKERSLGFTHSHDDDFNWDKFNKWQEEEAKARK